MSAKATIIASPTTLKSLLLKFVSLLNAADDSRRATAESVMTAAAQGTLGTFVSGIKKAVVGRVPDEAEERRKQSQLSETEFYKTFEMLTCACRILELIHNGVMLMDEVDMILNPLKSELRWPLGQKQALDLTLPVEYKPRQLEDDGALSPNRSPVAVASSGGGGGGQHGARNAPTLATSDAGLRFKMVFHLLEGLRLATKMFFESDFAVFLSEGEQDSRTAAVEMEGEMGELHR